LAIGTLKRGESFGEHSALNDLPNPFTVEALTKEVHLYKILRAHFIQYFGGMSGDPVTQLRAQIQQKVQWLRGKVDFIRELITNAQAQPEHKEEILKEVLGSLEFRNEEEAAKLRPTKTNPKEIPFNKNNPREKEMNAATGGGDAAGGVAEPPKTQRQREIEALKRSLLAPGPIPGKAGPLAPAAPAGGIFNKFNKDKEDDKFNKVMDWGTPRLVVKNRELKMDQQTMNQRAFLNNIASIRKGPVPDQVEEKKQGDFKAVSISNFREKMLKEEREENNIPATDDA
jgi:hypothetical protein